MASKPRSRLRSWHERPGVSLGGKLLDKVGDQSGPAGLVGCAAAAAVVAVEILVEQNVVLEMRIGLKLFVGSENRPPSVGPPQERCDDRGAKLVGDLRRESAWCPDPVGHSSVRPSR